MSLPALLFALAAQPGPHLDAIPDLVQEDEDTGLMAPSGCPAHRLDAPEAMPEMPQLYRIWHPTRSYGRPELVEVIRTAAEQVAWEVPYADPITVGDMSRKRGGPLAGHRSHQGGRDADLGLFRDNGQQDAVGFLPVSARDLDVHTTWVFLRAMLDTGMVERVLMDRAHIRVLRTHVVDTGELSQEEADRVFPHGERLDGPIWMQEGVIHHMANHHHHMHLRVRCASD